MTTQQSTAAAPSPTMTPRQVAVLVVLLASQFLMAADFSILNVALPRVGLELGFNAGDLQWITTTFALCAAGCTLVFGRIGDYLGRRRIFVFGMVILAVASVIGGLATDPALLLVARTLQGLATAAVTPAALALLTTTFTEPGLRAKALGLNGVMMSSGFSVGAVLGGVLTDALSWRWAFFINIPVAILAVIVVLLVVPESRADKRGRIDVPGAVLITLGLFSGIYGVTQAAETGLGTVPVLALVASAVLLGGFWVVENRTKDALVSTRILRRREVAFSNLSALFIFGGETALIFFTGLYVQNVLGFTPFPAGLVLLAIGIGQILGGMVGPRVIKKVPARVLLGLSLAGQGAFMLPLLLLPPASGWVPVLLATQFVNAIFSMLAMLAFMVIATSAVDNDEQGMATGMATQSQQVGIAIGIPLMSAVFTAVVGADAVGTEQLPGIHTAVGADGLLLVAMGLLLLFVLRRRSPRDTETAPAQVP
ncbi:MULTISPECIES: MFS transporter [unclassified Nocardiopsis]|uniref:MFS transporter n=1 Tax=unclassified Nocardiopsis TaxID=2649073 RepID=UPI001916A079|nr:MULTISPECIES: MFS transporter [unclassified Nocardiopsis]